MAASGINYFLNKGNLSTGNFKIFYDFQESGVIDSVSSGDSQFSGILSSEGNFFNVQGSGYFTGQTINIQKIENLAQSAWTQIFAYSKESSGRQILFSSFNSGNNIYSGYNIGINDANKLYFESYNNNGPIIRTFNQNLAKNNIVTLSYFNNNLIFSYYNPINKQLENENYSIDGDFLLPSNNWTLGGYTGSVDYIFPSNFTGYLDEYLYFDIALNKKEQESLLSGFIINKVPDQELIQTYTNYPITGYENSGISFELETGYNVTRIGTNYDNCGNSYPIYMGSGITGYFSGNVLVPLTGVESYSITGVTTGNLIPNTGYIQSLGFEGLSYLRKIDYNDTIELIKSSGLNNFANYNANYNYAENKFYNALLENQQVYLNGLAQVESGFYISGDVYNKTLYLSGDYLISGGLIESTGFYDENDRIIFDLFTGKELLYTGVSHVSGDGDEIFSVSGFNSPLSIFVFFNGQKLIQNENYFLSGNNNIYIENNHTLYEGATGNLFIFETPITLTNTITGNFASKISGFGAKSSFMSWLNGQRQTLNSDYLEISSIDLLNGSGIFGEFNNIHTGNLFFTESI